MKVTTRQVIRNQFNKLKRRLKNQDLTYILQEDSTNEHLEPHYVFQVTGFSTRLAPITFFSKDEDDLVRQVRERLRKLEFDEIEIAFLEANAQEHRKYAEHYEELAKNAKNRLLVEGSTNDILKPFHSQDEDNEEMENEEPDTE